MAVGGAVGGLLDGVFGGGGSKKNHAAVRAGKQNKYNKKLHDYNWSETQRGYDYQVDALKIKKKNDEINFLCSNSKVCLFYSLG